jgi:hypothetical protein
MKVWERLAARRMAAFVVPRPGHLRDVGGTSRIRTASLVFRRNIPHPLGPILCETVNHGPGQSSNHGLSVS